MIAWPEELTRLTGPERYGLETLIDMSRLVPVESDSAVDAVRIRILDNQMEEDLARWHIRGWPLAVGDGFVGVPRRLLQSITDVAGAAAEQRSDAADRYGRVPSSENPLVQAGLEREPVLSALAVALRGAVLRSAGGRPVRMVSPWPAGKRWAVAMSHDLDVVDWWPAFTILRIGELARKGEWRRARQVSLAAARSLARSPVLAGVEELLAAEHERGWRSSWFVLCGTPTWRTAAAGDLTYRPEGKVARRILAAVSSAGHEIGLHGSFATARDPTAMSAERTRLAADTTASIRGVRQHYLRMRPGDTQRAMLSSGFRYDATYGFPDRNGFRLGVADVVAGWDEVAGRESGLAEAPLIWMDRALSKYQRIEDPIAWVEDGLELAARARAVEGLWVGLWHPNLTASLGFPGAPRAFVRLLDGLGKLEPHSAPLGDLVDWRAARRRVRVRVGGDGALRGVLAEPYLAGMRLEDAQGTALGEVVRA